MAVHGALLAWAEASGRDLPWRRTRDPWAVLVSELMLQQTQVARVAPRYERFLTRFPDPAACAAAPVGEVVREWAGLGYNRRAVHLHRAATEVVRRHGGALPDRLDALMALPGVGRYTARAVLSFAFDADVGVVETNTARVLARAFAGRQLPSVAAAQDLADSVVPRGRSWAWNQAAMDLGAAVCTRRYPRCGVCPVRPWCRWAADGFPVPDPVEGSAGTGRPRPPFPAPTARVGVGWSTPCAGHRCHSTVWPPPPAGPARPTGPSGWPRPWWPRAWR